MIRKRIAMLMCLVLLGLGAMNCGARAQRGHLPLGVQKELGPGPILPISGQMSDFFAEHEVEISWPGEAHTMRAVLQKRDTLLELIVLGPMEHPMLRVYQQGEAVGVDQQVENALPFEPEFMLADVQKAFLPWGKDDERCQGGSVESLHWTETCVDGRPETRTFWREELGEGLPLTVHYDYVEGEEMPTAVILENAWFGYTLRIRTLRWAPL